MALSIPITAWVTAFMIKRKNIRTTLQHNILNMININAPPLNDVPALKSWTKI